MVWFAFAFLSAFFQSLKDVFSKRSLKAVDEYVVTWCWSFFTVIFLLPLLAVTGMPALGDKFWIALLAGASLDSASRLLYIKALKCTDLSIIAPMYTITPVFLLLTSPFIVGEYPTASGLAGVLLIAAGAYTLKIKERRSGYLGPFRALLREKGPRLMMLTVLIWSITANTDKLGFQNSSIVFWAVATNAVISAFLFPVMLRRSRGKMRQLASGMRSLLPMGLFNTLTLLFQFTAMSMALVSYVLSVKRIDTMMGVLFGHFHFKEEGVRERLAGAGVMVVGVALILLS